MLTFRCGAARTVFFILFPLAFLVSESYSQITIREKISISPARPQAVAFETPSNHSFLRFTYLRRSEATGRIAISGPCGIDTVAESPGNPVTVFSSTVVLIDPAPPGPYIVTVSTVPPGEPISAITVVIENENGFVASRGLAVPGSFQHQHLFFTGYSLTATKDLIEPNQSIRFFAEPVRECIATRFNTSGPLTLRIIEGVEFGQFYRVEFNSDFELIFVPLGTEITSFSSQLQQIDYLADGASPPPGGARIVAQAEWNGVFEADTFFVQGPPAFDHFAVGLEKDTIAFAETTKVFVRAKDESNNDTGLDGSALLILSVDSTSYGSFIAANGDTVPSPLTNVLYSDAQAGNIRFAAVNKNPDSVVSFKIFAKLQEDTTKTGDTTLVLLGKRLKININSPKKIWPTLPQGLSGGNPNNRNRKDSISIGFRIGLQPAASESVLVKTRFVTRTGGHDHENAPPGSLMGTLRQLGSSFERTGEIRLRTDGEGKFLIRYTAPLFGGRIEFLARSITDSSILATDTLDVKVDSLMALGTDSTYELVGAPDNHSGTNDPCRTTPPPSLHYSNHHGTSAMIAAIDSIAANYNRFHHGVRLRINDISLEHGGLFDLKNDWVYRDSVHWEHRIGKSADIGYSGINRENQCVTRLALGDMRALIGQFTTGGAPFEHSDHFHIRMR